MAGDQTITQLTADTTILTTDIIPVVDLVNGITKKTTVANLIPSGINGILFKALAADVAGGNVATAQPWFPVAGGVTVEAAKSYFFEGLLYLTRAAGAVSHTTSMLFGGTATLTGINYIARCKTGDTAASAADNSVIAPVATATVVKAASTSTTEVIVLYVHGIVRINAGGTFIPQFQYSVAPGGAPTVKANSYFHMFPIGDNAATTRGVWA